MIESGEASRLAALRLRIEGLWSVEDFQRMLLTLHNVYQPIAALMFLADSIREERQRNDALEEKDHYAQIDWTWSNLYFGTVRYNRDSILDRREPLSTVIAAVEPLLLPLGIDALRLESPGWVQVLGNWNPLKVMADFISKWRAENTKRMQINTTAATERERVQTQAALEQERMRRAFALEVLGQLPEEHRTRHAGRLAEIAEYAITPGTNALQQLANDRRIVGAEIVEVGASLPETTQPRRRGQE
jgi:hypothetical protein